MPGRRSGNIIRAMAGACAAVRRIPDFAVRPIADRRPCEDRDSSRRKSGYAVKHANKSRITDVSGLRSHYCTIIASTLSHERTG